MNIKVELSNGTSLRLTEVDGEIVIYDCVNSFGDAVIAKVVYRESSTRVRFDYDE